MTHEPATTAALYAHFGAREAVPLSPLYGELATAIGHDAELVALLDTLPRPKRQPNLLFASLRYLHGTPRDHTQLREWVLDDWPAVRDTMLARRTQTNEPGRCGALLPVLARLPGPLALIEVGASAGLCLYPDRYRYDYAGHVVGPADSPVTIDCAVAGTPPLPSEVPQVVSRGGVDLNPLDAGDRDDLRWLECLIWPGEEHRLPRLHGAAEVARREPPTILAGDLFELLPDAVSATPPGSTVVVFHTAVAAYLTPDDRQRLTDLMTKLDGHWISQEGAGVFPAIADRLPRDEPTDREAFVLALDGEPVAYSAPHGGWLDWF